MVDGTPKHAIQVWPEALVMVGVAMSIGAASGQ